MTNYLTNMADKGVKCVFVLKDTNNQPQRFEIRAGSYKFNDDGCLAGFIADGRIHILRYHYENWWEKLLASFNNPNTKAGTQLGLSRLSALGLNRMGLPPQYAGPIADMVAAFLRSEVAKYYPDAPEGYYTGKGAKILTYTPIVHHKDCWFFSE